MAQIRTATIANGASVSGAVEIVGRNITYEMGSRFRRYIHQHIIRPSS
jgi:hypothetical protein